MSKHNIMKIAIVIKQFKAQAKNYCTYFKNLVFLNLIIQM